MGSLVVAWFILSVCITSGFGLYFEDGYDHHYTYSSESDILGMHNITTIIKFRIRHVNESERHESLNQLMVDSFVQRSEHGYVVDNPLNWNFGEKFYFTVGTEGLVTLVHFHPEEIYEILTLKKVLASTLSLKVKVEDSDQWKFSSHEEDHAGSMDHEYEASRDSNGIRFVRVHKSSKDVHRLHNKTVHIDMIGTPVFVDAVDNVTLRHSPTQPKQKPRDSFNDIGDQQTDFPKIASISRSKMKMTLKRKHNEQGTHNVNELHKDTLSIKKRPEVKVGIQSVQADINKQLFCIHSIQDEYDRNRTECVNNLRALILSLKKDDFLNLATKTLTRQCDPNNTLCVDERNLFLDIIAREGSAEAQLLVLNIIMRSPNVTEEDLRRCLFHSIALDKPELELVHYAEQLCFEGNTGPGETPGLSKTQKRACLALGAMAKSLYSSNVKESDRLVQRIEDWLDLHNETRSRNIVKPRERRSIIQHDTKSRKHIETKTVLIQTLGNAGKQRSIRHIRSYMEPNVGVTAWRRAAIHSLRHFTCNESMHALVSSAVNDHDDIVRKTALKVLKKHPKRYNFTDQHENMVLSKNYSYPIITRVKRSLLQALEEGISVTINPGGIDWDKTIGTSNIGASFGLHLRNILDLKLKLLSGHFMVDVYDEAHAEAHVGMLNFNVDIIRAHVCFKGHISYDINVLKDFGINSLSDLVHVYDKIVGRIVTPIKTVVEDFKSIINVTKTLTNRPLVDIVKGMVKVVKNLPTIMGEVAANLQKFVKKIYDIAGSTIVEEIKIIIQEVRNFVDGVKQDILKFYNDIVDVVTSALPYIAKKIIESVELIFESLKHLINNPTQALMGMSRGVSQIKMAITMAIDVKNKVIDTCMFIKGRAAEWLDTAKQIPSMMKRLAETFKKLVGTLNDRKRRDLTSLETRMTSVMSDGINATRDSIRELKASLIADWHKVIEPLQPLLDFVKPFLDEFKAIMKLITDVKTAYTELKKVFNEGKSLVQKVFGPKFHQNLPTTRRKAQGECKDGVWPTTTQGTFNTTGVDLELGEDQSIVMPVNGILHTTSGKKVVIQPTDSEFTTMEIVIENINVKPKYRNEKLSVKAGEKIGQATKAPKCSPNYIHLSVRQPQTIPGPDENYEYTDPGPFLDRLVPIPKWYQDCKDFEFRYLDHTFESGESETNADPKSEKIERDPHGVDDVSDRLDKLAQDNSLDDFSSDGASSFKESLKKSLKEQAKKFAKFFKTALFGKKGPKVPNILDIVNVNKYNVEWILGKLDDNQSVYKDFKMVIGRLSNAMISLPEGNPAAMSLPFMKTFLRIHGLSSPIKGGDIRRVADNIMTMAGKACQSFKGAVASGFGHVCTVHDCCLGITCSVPLTFGSASKHISFSVAVIPEDLKVEVKYLGKTKTFQAHGFDEELDLDIKIFKMKISMVANAKLEGGELSLTAEIKLCTKLFSTCLPPIDLFHEIKFRLGHCVNKRSVSQEVAINKMNIPVFLSQLAEYQLLDSKTTKVLENVRDAVVNELMDDAVDKLGDIIQEFKDKVDFCVSGYLGVPSVTIPIFELKQRFMVGPVPLKLEFGAGATVGLSSGVGLCVVSMTTQLTLKPKVSGKVWGGISVDIGFAEGGIKLVGYLLQTKFPITTDLVFSKYPIDVGSKMDMELTPLRLQLFAYAKLKLIFTSVTVFEGLLWRYSVPKIVKNIFHKIKRDDDPSPPQITSSTVNQRTKRSGIKGCIVKQIPNRPYYDTAFSLEMHAQDEVSEVKLFYAIGTHRGGTNLVDWTDMGGNSLMVPARLPGGIPVYWSVKARNSQGLESISQCSLNTYDSTLPDGRVEHAYKFSSHPNKLFASIVAFEDSPLVETHYKAVGFSPGQFGSQVVDWQELRLDHSMTREDTSGYLKHFTVAREGKLVALILSTQKTRTPEICAQKCIEYGSNCVSFDFEHHSETCDIHDVIQGANAYLRISGTYSNYERLGSGYQTLLEYTNLPLTHGTTYFVNARVRNILGYEAFLIGEGSMVDFTPPEPGLMNATSDILRADKCKAAVTQRCTDVTWKNNHRIITDGTGSGTVFNGHEPLHDELYTLTNHYVSANWKGFHDNESGIWGYTWAVGSKICGTDIVGYKDPYAHLTSKKFWTDSGFQKDIHLPDGPYFVSVQALNGAELGGSLVTTVCHSTPFIVDTTPPVFNGVTDIIYDEDFDLIAIYYDATDDLSKISDAEFGLGKTKYDVQLKPYSLHASMDRDDPFVAVEDLGLEEGVPAWIRIRVTNNVDLFTSGHGDEPILIDKSPPNPGTVLDGDKMGRDKQFQSDDSNICAQWIHFFDPESGIDRFLWGVGTTKGSDDIVKFRNLTQYEKSSCAPALLNHNHVYYSTVFAYNSALNSKSANSTSDGVLVDITPPNAGNVQDGQKGQPDQEFTSETVSKYANWNGYFDPESGIDHYEVDVLINNEHMNTFNVDNNDHFEDHTISMEHNDRVYFNVYGANGANLKTPARSNGLLVDLTTPILTAIADTETGLAYQDDKTKMQLMWDFSDPESGIKEYRVIIYETQFAVKRKFWPQTEQYNTTTPPTPTLTRTKLTLENLSLKDGAQYSLHVTALNRALLSTSHETPGVTIDSTRPSMPKVHIGLPKDEENLDGDGNILHDDQNGIRISWSARDSESGIDHYLIAIGTDDNEESIQQFIEYSGTENTARIKNIHFETFSESGAVYVVSMKAINGAGLVSTIGKSKNVKVQKANIPGVVFDGRNRFTDDMYTIDHTSIAASFHGFESERCNIVSYDWAIGTSEYGTDIQTFTKYGLVMLNDTHGQCQIHTELFEDTTYYITVRAVTGCNDEYILSSSDGVTLDRNPPTIVFEEIESNDTSTSIVNGVMYQASTDTLALSSNVTDKHSIASVQYALGSLPLLDDLHPFTDNFEDLTSVVTLMPGSTTFITTNTSDRAGNINVTSSLAIIADNTSPTIHDLDCIKHLSKRKSILTCEWKIVQEYESVVDNIVVSLGTDSSTFDILDSYNVVKGTYTFERDLNDPINTSNITSVFVQIKISNVIGQQKIYGRTVIVDRTPPQAERLDVVTSIGTNKVTEHQKCQLPRSYVELELHGAFDEESGIDNERFEVCIGYKPFGSEIVGYRPTSMNADGKIFFDGFSLNPGAIFYATIRIYNKAGLKSEITSDSVVISQAPTLTVTDGNAEEDIDYQSLPNLIQGRWEYSDSCPIKEASWSVSDLTGKVLFDFLPIPSASKIFYNDEVGLENGMKYVVTVKTVDFLGRPKIARSDGVSIRIQPPLPGFVRDGDKEDLNYQFSTTELSCNWDDFGDKSNDPTQEIHHYEVAIGNDRRYSKTRSNVHFFVNVGLNTSYTFEHLNLTAKLVKYYITVRSYSKAGGYTEGYSNGIRVGFEDAIDAGTVSLSKYQSSTTSIEVSWTGFRSDIDIIDYEIGLSSQNDFITNDTLKCIVFRQNTSVYNVYPLTSVGQNEFVKVSELKLHHGQMFYVTIIAKDEAGMCTGVTSEQILVDTTPPEKGKLFVNGIESTTVSYARLDTEMHFSWEHFKDNESEILQTYAGLFECKSCEVNFVSSSKCFLIADNLIQGDSKTSFYELQLDANRVYYAVLNFTNGAGLTTRVQSSSILIDTNSPLIGEVKIADDWNSHKTYQSLTNELHGLLAIANTIDDYICPTQSRFFPSEDPKFTPFSSEFSTDYVIVNNSGAYLGIGYNADLTSMVKSSVLSETQTLQGGNYTFSLRSASGTFTVTTIALVTDTIVVPFVIDDKPIEQEFDYSRFENITGLEASEGNITDDINATTTMAPITTKQLGSFVLINDSNINNETNFDSDEYGFGIHFLGYKTEGNKNWHHLLWARGKFSDIQHWFQLPFDPSTGDHSYTIQVDQKVEFLEHTLDLTLIVDNEEIISISNFKFYGDVKLAALAWNENNFQPPIKDIYKPFYSDAVIRGMDIPDTHDKPCRHGKAFYDAESSIKELWVGVSDNNKEVGNVSPMQHYKTFCYPCIAPCQNLCNKPCHDERHSDGYDLIQLNVHNLNLKMADMDDICNNVTNDVKCNNTAYYLNVKAINFAGEESIAYSNAIQIDVTPPQCEYVKCLDPDFDKDQPTSHLGSSSTVGAYWNCTEDISIIEYFSVRVLSSSEVIMNSTNVGLKSKVHFMLENGTFKDGETYSVEVSAINSAGVFVSKNCSVRVKLFPPNVAGASAEPLYTSSSSSSEDEDMPYWAESQNSIGIQWQGGNDDIEYYEWQIGTVEGSYDVFPPLIVGEKKSGSSAIVHGKVEFNGMKINKTVAEFRNLKNMTPEEIKSVTHATDQEKSFFNMEPGRCVHQSLYGVGYSHIKSKIQGKSVCVKRINDVYINATQHKMFATKPMGTNKWMPSSTAKPEVTVYGKLTKGGLSLGSLSNDDMNADYGSAATIDYKPFISNPVNTLTKTSRMLRNRIQKLCNISFFVSPAPHVDYETIGINVTVHTGCHDDGDFQPALIYWNNVKEQWVHIDEGCRSYLAAVMDSYVYTSEVCKSNSDSFFRGKRSALGGNTSTLASPKMFSLARINKTFPNHPPRIITNTIHVFEDDSLKTDIETVDIDNDTLIFHIKEQPKHLNCTIEQTTGKLHCSLEEDYYGYDSVKIKITETGLPPTETILSDEKSIAINVSAVSDSTDRYFIKPNGTIHSDKRPSMVHTYTVNANSSSSLYLGALLLADVDGNETYVAIPKFTPLGNSTYTLNKRDALDFELENVSSRNYRSLNAQNINFQYSPDLNGNMTLNLISRASKGDYTPSVTLNLFVLLDPCVHGHCSHPVRGEQACNDTKRSKSFDEFICVCNPGYEGEWCQTDTNECAGEPCALMFDCEDLINDYQCNINIPKLMAILICSAIAIGATGFFIFKLLKRFKIYKSNKIGVSTENLKGSEFNMMYNFDNPLDIRPSTSGSERLELKNAPPVATEKPKEVVNISALMPSVGMLAPPHHAQKGKTTAKKIGFKGSRLDEDKKFLEESLLTTNTEPAMRYERPNSQMTDINV